MEGTIIKDSIQWQRDLTVSKQTDWVHKALHRDMPHPGAIMRIGTDVHVVTPEGVRIAYPTDYILLNEDNELYIYICTEKEFIQNYA